MIAIPLLLVVLFLLLINNAVKRRKSPAWLIVASVTCFLMLISNRFIGGVYNVPTASMEPLLHSGDYVAAVRFGGLLDDSRLVRGDIVVFKAPSVPRTLYIKRIIGIPGDKITFDSDKIFRINGMVLGNKARQTGKNIIFSAISDRDGKPYEFVIDSEAAYVETKGYWIIPEGYYFMAGDNRDHSWDSRYWENPPGTPKPIRGLVPIDRIEARFVSKLFNFNPLNSYDAMDGAMKVFRENADETKK